MAKIITFTGLGGSGKDTCADLIRKGLESKGLRVFTLAYGDPVKSNCSRNHGYNEAQKIKQRNILTWWGTDTVRKLDPDFWVKIANMFVELLKDRYDVFIMTDARFENEINHDVFSYDIPIYNILVVREDSNLSDEQSKHSSEQLPERDQNLFDCVIRNDSSLEDLEKLCNLYVDYLGEWFREVDAA